MKEHPDIIELKQFTGGGYPAKKTFEISNHLHQCAACRENLRKISPNFFVTPISETAEMTAAENEKHFSDDELKAFLKAELPVVYRLKMSEHLRKCADCKSKLYQQDPAILKQTISNILSKKERIEKHSFFSQISFPISIGAVAVLLIGMLYFVLFTGDNKYQSTLQTKVTTNENLQQLPLNQSVITNSDSVSSNKISVVNTQKLNENTYLNSSNKNKVSDNENSTEKGEINKKADKSKIVSNTDKIVISNSRSVTNSSNCLPDKMITGVYPYFETITETQPLFRWKSVANALKYHLYISDTEQILVEEFETEKDTSYKLKTTLEPNKSYKWKVIADLPEGKTLNSESIRFTTGKTARKYAHKTENNLINQSRCIP